MDRATIIDVNWDNYLKYSMDCMTPRTTKTNKCPDAPMKKKKILPIPADISKETDIARILF